MVHVNKALLAGLTSLILTGSTQSQVFAYDQKRVEHINKSVYEIVIGDLQSNTIDFVDPFLSLYYNDPYFTFRNLGRKYIMDDSFNVITAFRYNTDASTIHVKGIAVKTNPNSSKQMYHMATRTNIIYFFKQIERTKYIEFH